MSRPAARRRGRADARSVLAAAGGLAVLAAGWLAAPGLAALLAGAAGVVAVAGSAAWPGLPGLRTAVALAYLAQLATAGSVSLPAVVVGAWLLAGYLAAGEVRETGVPGRAGWAAHAAPVALAGVGVLATALVSRVVVGGVSGAAALGVAAALSAGLAILLVPGPGRDRRPTLTQVGARARGPVSRPRR